MYSYHRLLQVFGRSIHDNTLECNLDVHPWEIKINGKNWSGKVRLIGFVDVFFIISYSGNARFEDGIIVYKDKLLLQELDSKVRGGETSPKEPANLPAENDDEGNESADEESSDAGGKSGGGDGQAKPLSRAEAEAEFTHRRTYRIKSRGHHIGLSTKYLKSSVEHYTVEIIKPRDWTLRRQVKRGIRPHDMAQLLVDVVRYGVISQGQLMGHVGGLLFNGGILDETAHKFLQGVMANTQAGQQALSNEAY
ncbi:hypothetical protein ASPCADRAFT_205207 [Aspergillus carbonarius ITEM 5010]|uniref:Uncharacterized protein n=1 Tax=Aspergillus carbonarius (strain ITEM 5010) TaxID=602072 RepID=A0A1R3RTZ3_ASPC5|nr:hypothetical protein ASPCADRAFT_205207 [Aspergillus carbonarius ITEM 5010]